METSVPLLGVLLATLSSFIVGGLWYSPSLFLTPWQKMTGTSDADMKKRFVPAMAATGVASLITAYVLAHFTIYAAQATGASGIAAGLQASLWVWFGFVATTIVANSSLDSRDPMVMAIQAGNRLVTLLVMGLIIGAFL